MIYYGHQPQNFRVCPDIGLKITSYIIFQSRTELKRTQIGLLAGQCMNDNSKAGLEDNSLNPTQVCRPLATQPVKLLKCSEIYFFKNYCLSCSYCKKTHKDIIIVHGGQFLVKDTVIARNTIKKKGNNFHSYNNINVMFCFIMFIH